MPHDEGKGNLLGSPAEAVATGHTAFTFDDTGGLEVVQDLLEKAFGYVLLFGNGLDTHN
jgi:hypothetical protein